MKTVALEHWSTNSHFLEPDTSHWQSISYQATQRFKISLREVYFTAGSLGVMKNIMKMLSSTFYKSLGHFNMFTVKWCSETVFLTVGGQPILIFSNKILLIGSQYITKQP